MVIGMVRDVNTERARVARRRIGKGRTAMRVVHPPCGRDLRPTDRGRCSPTAHVDLVLCSRAHGHMVEAVRAPDRVALKRTHKGGRA